MTKGWGRGALTQSLAIGLATFALALSVGRTSCAAETMFPGETWETVDPEKAGWSKRGLKEAREQFRGMGSTALLVVHDGRIVVAWGKTTHPMKIHSVRKSFMSALYGVAVARGQIDLDRTLAELRIDDKPPRLTANEKQATVRDLLKARSGVYHVAAAEPPRMKQLRPERGSHSAGTFGYYNNWDFNALGTILRNATQEDTFVAMERHLARPIGMERFTAKDGSYARVSHSEHPAYHMHFTARDLARFGWLFLNRGRWGDRTVIPTNWVAESTKVWSPNARRGVGYGYMWWVAMKQQHFGTNMGLGAFSARGNGGQYIVISPQRRIVAVHLNDQSENDKLEGREFSELMRRVFAAAPR
jgi:CubicO group peptidase (beta-lactamase class C family)